MQKVVCFSGQMASGKDRSADHLVTLLEDFWQRTAFGDGVKQVFMDMFDVDREFIEKWKRNDECPPNFHMNIRKSLQFIGDGYRQIRPNVWVDLLFRRYPSSNLIISDGRYYSEVEAVKDRGGLNVLIWRPGFENDINHPSEAQLKPETIRLSKMGFEGIIPEEVNSPFDWFLINGGDLDALFNKVETQLFPYLKDWF